MSSRDPIPPTPILLRYVRVTRVILQTLYGIALASFGLPFASATQRDRIIQHWTRGLLSCFNIRVVVHGEPPTKVTTSTLFVGNHVSWVDIHAINSLRPIRFIAKSEIRSWPVFGWFAAKANTLFIEREKRQDAAKLVHTVAQSLRQGDCMCYFPEGTTTEGNELKPFKGSLIQAAIEANTPLWPFTVKYPDAAGNPNIAMAFAGETTLLESIWTITGQRAPEVHLTFLPKLDVAGKDRRQLTHEARAHIAESLQLS